MALSLTQHGPYVPNLSWPVVRGDEIVMFSRADSGTHYGLVTAWDSDAKATVWTGRLNASVSYQVVGPACLGGDGRAWAAFRANGFPSAVTLAAVDIDAEEADYYTDATAFNWEGSTATVWSSDALWVITNGSSTPPLPRKFDPSSSTWSNPISMASGSIRMFFGYPFADEPRDRIVFPNGSGIVALDTAANTQTIAAAETSTVTSQCATDGVFLWWIKSSTQIIEFELSTDATRLIAVSGWSGIGLTWHNGLLFSHAGNNVLWCNPATGASGSVATSPSRSGHHLVSTGQGAFSLSQQPT